MSPFSYWWRRYESLRHCKWVDEIIEDAPWYPDVAFLDKHNIDFICHDALPYGADGVDDIYAEIKKVTQENEALLKKFYQEKDALEKLKELFVATDDNARKVVDYAKNEAVIEAGKKMAGEKEEKVKGSVEEVKPKKKAGRPKKVKE